MGLQKYVEVEEPEEEELEIMAAEKELADLDEQFSGLLLDTDIADNMQVVGEDGEAEVDVDVDSDVALDDEVEVLDEGLDLGAEIGDFDEIEE